MSGFGPSNEGRGPLTHAELRQFTGDLERFRHPLNSCVIYTPGVKHLADRAGAYWLLDDIAIFIGSRDMHEAAEANSNFREMQFWKLIVKPDSSAELDCEDGNGLSAGLGMTYGFTDFPLDHAEIWAAFNGLHWTLYLPSEH